MLYNISNLLMISRFPFSKHALKLADYQPGRALPEETAALEAKYPNGTLKTAVGTRQIE